MMVENAERFGLAALHQLRGRVGRGNLQSYCIFISGKKNKEVMERLNVLADSNDGFYIAGEDLKRRGPEISLVSDRAEMCCLRWEISINMPTC